MAKIKVTFPHESEKYPLSLDYLQAGSFYESDNDTFVFVGRGELDTNNPINIENGIGGYTNGGCKFRKLPKGTVLTITI